MGHGLWNQSEPNVQAIVEEVGISLGDLSEAPIEDLECALPSKALHRSDTIEAELRVEAMLGQELKGVVVEKEPIRADRILHALAGRLAPALGVGDSAPERLHFKKRLAAEERELDLGLLGAKGEIDPAEQCLLFHATRLLVSLKAIAAPQITLRGQDQEDAPNILRARHLDRLPCLNGLLLIGRHSVAGGFISTMASLRSFACATTASGTLISVEPGMQRVMSRKSSAHVIKSVMALQRLPAVVVSIVSDEADVAAGGAPAVVTVAAAATVESDPPAGDRTGGGQFTA
jgi:hypothetical protein